MKGRGTAVDEALVACHLAVVGHVIGREATRVALDVGQDIDAEGFSPSKVESSSNSMTGNGSGVPARVRARSGRGGSSGSVAAAAATQLATV